MNDPHKSIEQCCHLIEQIKTNVNEAIIGQDEVIDQMLWCMFAGGHALLEGIPGLGKTMLVRTTAEVLNLSFSRIQFTPDLMPADITGTNVIPFDKEAGGSLQFQPGPIFGHFILADEINRATPKTQSALLEAMQEKTVTIGTNSHALPKPFFVLATQNPLESEGTYPLPEAQLDRFVFKIRVDFPSTEQLIEIAKLTTSTYHPKLDVVAGAEEVLFIQQTARSLLISDSLLEQSVAWLMATHPDQPHAPQRVKQFVQYGAGPRGMQAMIMTAKVRALMNGRMHVTLDDLRETAIPSLRHRVLLNFAGEAEGIDVDELLKGIVDDLASG